MASSDAMKVSEGFLVFEESSAEIDERLQIRLAETLDDFRLKEARWWHKKLHWALGMPCDGTMEECKRVAAMEKTDG